MQFKGYFEMCICIWEYRLLKHHIFILTPFSTAFSVCYFYVDVVIVWSLGLLTNSTSLKISFLIVSSSLFLLSDSQNFISIGWIFLWFRLVKVHALVLNVKMMVNIIPVIGETQIAKNGYLQCFWNDSLLNNSETSDSIWVPNPWCSLRNLHWSFSHISIYC